MSDLEHVVMSNLEIVVMSHLAIVGMSHLELVVVSLALNLSTFYPNKSANLHGT